jgi:hypothetical protein
MQPSLGKTTQATHGDIILIIVNSALSIWACAKERESFSQLIECFFATLWAVPVFFLKFAGQ